MRRFEIKCHFKINMAIAMYENHLSVFTFTLMFAYSNKLSHVKADYELMCSD